MFRNSKSLLIICNLSFLLTYAQERQKIYKEESYEKISGLFDAYSENDQRALAYVKIYIDKAKHENNATELIRGYEEAIYYSRDVDRKLSYADSIIITAEKNGDKDQISRAYLGKGIIFYYNRRQFKKALAEYIKAFKFSKNSHNDYLKNKVVYHLGMVKSYLGSYKEAAHHFEETAAYFERNMSDESRPNAKLNNESGYFNSIYRLSTCYKNLQLFSKEDSLIKIGLEKLQNTKQFSLEYGYFHGAKGIQLLRLKKLDEALKHLLLSQEILNNNEDYASLTTLYFYIGKLYWSKENREESLLYLNKVDSLVNKFSFITPEIRSAYRYLINDAKQKQNHQKQLYYRDQLLKTDSIINADFVMLSFKISREYDTDTLLEAQKNLENKQHRTLFWSLSSGILLSMLLLFSFWRSVNSKKREKELNAKYEELLKRVNDPFKKDSFDQIPTITLSEKNLYSPEIVNEIKTNLKIFESKKLFIQKGLTLENVAQLIGSNRTHLSFVLNEHLNIKFSTYLKELRIKYITDILLEDKKYLNYSQKALADECGIGNRQVFSKYFNEINGMVPVDFIRKRKEELDKV